MLLLSSATITTTLASIPKGTDVENVLTLSVTVILAVFIVITLLGNGLVCLAFYKQPYLRKVSYYPIISLAIADLLCGAVAMPAYIAKKHVDGGWREGVVCDVFRFSYFFTEYASVLSLTAISIERFVAIKMPVKHKTWLTSRKMTAALVFSWLDAALVSALPFFWRRNDSGELCHFDPTKGWSMMVILANVFLPFLIMLCCHLYTVSYAVRNFRKRISQCSWTDNLRISVNTSKRQRDITHTFALVVGIFIVCWGPSSFYYFIQMVCPECYGASFKKIKPIFNAVVKLLTFVNSCLNPLVYCWINLTLRNGIYMSLLGKTEARRRRHSSLHCTVPGSALFLMVNQSPPLNERHHLSPSSQQYSTARLSPRMLTPRPSC